MKNLVMLGVISAFVLGLTGCGAKKSDVSLAAEAPKLSPETLQKMRADMAHRKAEFMARRAAEVNQDPAQAGRTPLPQ